MQRQPGFAHHTLLEIDVGAPFCGYHESVTTKAIATIKRKTAVWLQQGITPRRLAVTLALGFAIGCIPVVGIPTFVCAGLAVALGLNLPAIQAANYAAMPLQLALIVPFVRLGGRLHTFAPRPALDPHTLLHTSPVATVATMGALAAQALLAWVLVAIPAVALMTAVLTLLLRRIPAVAAGERTNEEV
ncbi:MAG: DUF2062 domain-containing protein [Terracidiphilus sp.]|jgi:uncharacterized protein (DUF2062 family)